MLGGLHQHHHLGRAELSLFVVQDNLIGHAKVMPLVPSLDRVQHPLPRDPSKRRRTHLSNTLLINQPPLLLLHQLGGQPQVGGQLMLEPGVLPYLRYGNSLHGVHHQHPWNQISRQL